MTSAEKIKRLVKDWFEEESLERFGLADRFEKALHAAIDELQAAHDAEASANEALQARILQLEAQAAQYKEHAEMYQWWRAGWLAGERYEPGLVPADYNEAQVDAAIRAAMKEGRR